ncbi:hypothetical protein PENTCL1PPCAC_19770, partial [Pristionchus entomophagus]
RKEKRRRIRLIVSLVMRSKPLKYPDSMEDSDENEEPPVKKGKSESKRRSQNVGRSEKGEVKSNSAKKDGGISKMSDTELDCLECEYRTVSLSTNWRRSVYVYISSVYSVRGLSNYALWIYKTSTSSSQVHTPNKWNLPHMW